MADNGEAVRLASVGLGLWGTALAEAALASGQVHLETCYAPSSEGNQAFARRFQCRPALSFQAILEDAAVEGIILATPNKLHHSQIQAGAAHGKHVFVEKPLALTLRDALLATQYCTEHGVILAVGHQYRRQGAIRTLKQLVDRGELGQIIGFEANISTSKALAVADDNWRWSPDECPGGPLIQIGIHYIDILNYLFGPVLRVSGIQRHRASPLGIDDSTVTMLEHDSGVLGVLVSHYVTARVASIRVSGTHAIANFDPIMGLTLRRDEKDRAHIDILPSPANQPLVEQLAEFVTCIRGHSSPEVGGSEGTHALAVVLAAVQSNQTGCAVELSDLYQQAQSASA